MPAASYFAEGFAIISTALMLSPAMVFKYCFNASPDRREGFPSIKICRFPSPRNRMFSSLSKRIPGNLLKVSKASFPAPIPDLSTSTIILSPVIFMSRFFCRMTTASSSDASTVREMFSVFSVEVSVNVSLLNVT